MKKIGFLVFIAAIVIGVVVANMLSWGKASGEVFSVVKVNFGAEQGSGHLAAESRDISDFRKVDVGGVFQVEIAAQKDFGVEVEADDNLLQFIKTEVRGDTLHISMDKRVKTSNSLRVRVGMPDIERIEASGASFVNLVNVQNSELAIDTSGASKLNLAGETGNLIVDVSGASKIDAGGLTAATATVDASGASNVSVNATNQLIADASGASRITYSGSPKLSKSTSGASSITQK